MVISIERNKSNSEFYSNEENFYLTEISLKKYKVS